jgi:PmbA protein
MSAPDEWIADIAGAAATSTSTWQLLTVAHRHTTAEFGSGEISGLRSLEQVQACLRVVRGGRVGTATTTRLGDARALVAEACSIADHGAIDVGELDAHLDTLRTGPGDGAKAVEDPLLGLQQFADAMGKLQDSAELLVHGTLTHHHVDVSVADPAGAASYRRRLWQQELVTEGHRDPSLQLVTSDWTTEAVLSPHWTDWLAEVSHWQDLPEADVSGDDCSVILAPSALHDLLSPLLASLDGQAWTSGRSFLAGRLGEPLLHPAISIVDGDDPTWPLRVPVDDEGTPTAARTLVDAGVPVGLYHNRRTARQCGEAPTGHGYRGHAIVKRPLRPVMPNLNATAVAVRSDHQVDSLTELMSRMGSGIIIESLLGAHQAGALRPVVDARIRVGVAVDDGEAVARLSGQPVSLDLRALLGPRFQAATAGIRPVGRTWHAGLPFVLTGGVDL